MLKIDYTALGNRQREISDKYDKDQQIEYLVEDDCLMHFFGAGGVENYESIANFCIENNIEAIVDIGCAYGHQKEIFDQANIHYTGINDNKMDFWKNDGDNYLVGTYPCDVFVERDTLAVSVLCLTWNVYLYEKEKTLQEQCEALQRDFKHCLLYTTDEGMACVSKYFKETEKVGQGLYYFSN